MQPHSAAALSALLAVVSAVDLTFPPGFQFGAASAAYQIEGAWNVSDKGVSLWDSYTHTRQDKIRDHSNADVACDSYNLWRTDVQMTVDLGLDYYRFSIAWARLMPTGFPNHISEDGKRYYNNLIDELIRKGTTPMVTIYHWEMPQKLQNLGGWTNPLIVDWFADYANVVLSLFGDRVKIWITINEPSGVCDVAYSDGQLAPGIYDPDHAMYLCNKHVILAHAKAWRIFDTEYRPKFGGVMSLSNHVMWLEGQEQEDNEIADLAMHFSAGRYSHPIYAKEGGWPPAIQELIAENSKSEGYSKSRLPVFTQEEIELIRGTFDFYGVNYYTSKTVRKAKDGEKFKPWSFGDAPELKAKLGTRREWGQFSAAISLYSTYYPPGLRHALRWLRKQYGDLNFMIIENGYSNTGDHLEDTERIQYIKQHLEQVLLGIHEDHLNITRYTYWSLMDNFEWMDGYTTKFGLYAVNFKDEKRERMPRLSAHYYRSIINAHSLDVPDQPLSWKQSYTASSTSDRVVLPLILYLFSLLLLKL